MASVFFSYSHADEELRDQLEIQLAMLKRTGLIETWHDRRIRAGDNFGEAISDHVENDDVLLLLVSPDFLASDYCYEKEMARALERHEAGEARVIPVILRPCDWQDAPFGKLLAAPTDGKPVTKWPDKDDAFLDVVRQIKEALPTSSPAEYKAMKNSAAPTRPLDEQKAANPRSSNLRLKKAFTERDRDRFKVDSFEYIAGFFENSLDELEARNDGIETNFRRVDANRFVASIYRDGNSIAKCTIFMGGESYLNSGIGFVYGETDSSNTLNDSVSVGSDDYSLYLTSMFGAAHGERSEKMSQEGASEYFWSLLIGNLR